MTGWPTREFARDAGSGITEATSHLTLIKALYILAGGDRAKVRAAVLKAEDVRLKDVRGPKVPDGVATTSGGKAK
jgi:hypothetical protein